MKRAYFALPSAVFLGLVFFSGFQNTSAQNRASHLKPMGVLTRGLPAGPESDDPDLLIEPQSINVFQIPAARPSTGLVIVPTFDATITGNTNSAAIEAMINQAISIIEAQFADRITVSILFRYSTTGPSGIPLGGNLAQSGFPIYPIAWDVYKGTLRTDARTANDLTAITSLPVSGMTANVILSSSNGRALGLDTPGTMNSNGGSTGGTFDGIVTLNSGQPFSFTRPPGSNFDAVRTIQHETDEVLGLGSYINSGLSDVEPQDLFSWSSAGTRNTTSTGNRYFSINGGVANIVGFNQNPGGDFGDWLSGNCPQTTPYVQNAFSCVGQVSDITPTSPEGINLDVIGYNPGNASTGQFKFDYDGDNKSDISVYRASTGSWYLLRSQAGMLGVTFGLSTDKIIPADYDGDGKTDIAVYRPSTGVWFIVNSATGTVSYHVFGIAEDLPVPADYDGDGQADVAVFRPSSGTWYRLNSGDGMPVGIQFGINTDKPTLGDFDGDGKADIAVYRPSTGTWYHINSSNSTVSGEQFGISSDLVVPADYDGDSKTDVAVYRASSGYWYIKKSTNSDVTATHFGISEDIPAPGDFDGDGKADLSVFRPSSGIWYMTDSSNGSFQSAQFGTNGDKPTQSAFRY